LQLLSINTALKHNFILGWDGVTMNNETAMILEMADFKVSGVTQQ